MRFMKHLAPWVVPFFLLAASGCSQQNERVATLEEENAKLKEEKESLDFKYAAMNEMLQVVVKDNEEARNVRDSMRGQLDDHIRKLAQAEAQRQTLTKILEEKHGELREALEQYTNRFTTAQTASEKQTATLSKRAEEIAKTSETRTAQLEEMAKTRLAELVAQIVELQQKVAKLETQLEKAETTGG